MVGRNRIALGADVRNVVAGAHELRLAKGHEVTKFGVRTVVEPPVVFQSDDLAVLVCSPLGLDFSRRAFPRVGNVLELVVDKGYRLAVTCQASHAQKSFHGGAELIAKGTARRVLDDAQLLGRNSDAGANHGMMQVQADALGQNGQRAVFFHVGRAAVRFQVQVRLTAVVGRHLDRIGRILHQRPGFLTFHNALFVVRVRNAGVDFHGVGGQGLVATHVGRQHFQIHFDFLRRRSGMFLRIRGYDGDRVTELKNLFFAQDRTVPSVSLVGREGYEPGNGVLAFHILPGDDFDHAGHLFGLRRIDADDVRVRNFGLGDGQAQRTLRHAQGHVRAEIPGAGNLCQGRRTHKVAPDHARRVFKRIEYLFRLDLAAHDPGGIHHRIDEGLVAGAAAQIAVPLEPVANFRPCRVLVVVQQDLGGHDKTRCTDAALRAAVSHPCNLQGMQILGGADALDRGNPGPLRNFLHFCNASPHRFSVHNNGAGAAMALVTADLTSGQEHLFSQHLGQGRLRCDHEPSIDPVDVEHHPLRAHQ